MDSDRTIELENELLDCLDDLENSERENKNLKSLNAELLAALRDCWDEPEQMAGIIDRALEKAEAYEHEYGTLQNG